MSDTKQLSLEELKYIDSFCKKKDIDYIDLRIELVDHLAELVLERQTAHPTENFKAAFYAVYKSYGIFGFMNIAEQHQKQMQKHYWREIWQYFKIWCTLPKLFLTLGLSAFFYALFYYVEGARLPAIILIFALTSTSVVTGFYQYRRNSKILSGEKSILTSGAYQSVGWYFYMLVQLSIQAFGHNFDDNFLLLPGFLTAFLVFTIIFLAANYVVLEKAKEQLYQLKAQML